MSGEEIKQKIDHNNAQLELIEQSSIMKFILNPKAAALIEENKRLQAQCPHKFKKGVCVFCGIEEEKNGD